MIILSGTYDRDLEDKRGDLYILDEKGDNIRCLTYSSHLNTYRKLHWLTNGTSVLFSSYNPAEQFYTVDLDKLVIRPFTDENGQKSIKQITYDQKIFYSTHGHYWMIPINGALADRVKLFIEGVLVSVSPDGQWAAVYKEEKPDLVYIQNLITSDVHSICMSDSDNNHEGDSRTVVWSPNSRYLAYEADYQDLWVMQVDGTQRRKVGELHYFWNTFRWSPDSAAIAFIGPTAGDDPVVSEAPLYVSAIDHPMPRYLATLHKRDESGGAWDWLSNGRYIVYASQRDSYAYVYKVHINNAVSTMLTDPKRPFTEIYDVVASQI